MTKAFRMCTLRAWPAVLQLLNTNDGWEEKASLLTKQNPKPIEIPEKRNSFSL
jgi:hypothetical protein